VQGRLQSEPLSVEIETECACCGKAIRLQIEGDMTYRLLTEETELLVFEPSVDWSTFTEPNIINAY